MSLPYKTHPLYTLRKATIVVVLIGFLLLIITFDPYYSNNIICMFYLAACAIFSTIDVLCYAAKKAANPEADPPWPNKWIMIIDLLISIWMFVSFWFLLEGGYCSSPLCAFRAYGVLTVLLCSCLHLRCYWKQLMARYKKSWLAALPTHACARCGFHDNAEDPILPVHNTQQPAPRQELPHNVFPYDGPSASFQPYQATAEFNATSSASMPTPSSSGDGEEEGLLINSVDCVRDYGAFVSGESREPTLEQPEEIVVVSSSSGRSKKGKKMSKKEGKEGKERARDDLL